MLIMMYRDVRIQIVLNNVAFSGKWDGVGPYKYPFSPQ